MAEESVRPVGPALLTNDQAWHVAQRWQQFDGEYRANYLRIISVTSFYVVHLFQYYHPFGFFDAAEQPGRMFHLSATVLSVAWLMIALGVDLCLRQRIFPSWMAYATTGLDILLLTSIICLGGGQQSPLVLGYLLVLILSSLRISLPLIRFTAIAAMVGYLYVLAMGKWPQMFGGREIGVVPRYVQVMTLLAIGISGIMLGQLIRRFHGMARYYASRMAREAADHE